MCSEGGSINLPCAQQSPRINTKNTAAPPPTEGDNDYALLIAVACVKHTLRPSEFSVTTVCVFLSVCLSAEQANASTIVDHPKRPPHIAYFAK